MIGLGSFLWCPACSVKMPPWQENSQAGITLHPGTVYFQINAPGSLYPRMPLSEQFLDYAHPQDLSPVFSMWISTSFPEARGDSVPHGCEQISCREGRVFAGQKSPV
ncbi:hypothetical protein VTK26DRAFT_1444 [Humicola hyalothermophila]